MRRRRWLKVIKDYDFEIVYHHGKTNKVADALSRRLRVSVNASMYVPWEFYMRCKVWNYRFVANMMLFSIWEQ